MKYGQRIGVSAIALATGVLVMATGALAVRPVARRPARPATADAGAPAASRTITIPVMEASNMIQQMRVYLFTPPAGATAFGTADMPAGRKVWALLPSCRPRTPDDVRDPCAVGRVTLEPIGSTVAIETLQPMLLGATPESRRVQVFSVPESVTQVRIVLHRRDDAMRYEAAVDASQLGNLPAPEGHAGGMGGFSFDTTRYLAN